MIRIVYITIALICIALGSIGIIIPVLPTTPFFLLATFFLAKSSERLETWFMNTKIYKKYILDLKQNKSLPLISKIYLITSITALMVIGFIFMKGIIIGQIILAIVWILHIIYFAFIVKTSNNKNNN